MLQAPNRTCASLCLRVFFVILLSFAALVLVLHILTITCVKYKPRSDDEITLRTEMIAKRKKNGKMVCLREGNEVVLDDVIDNIPTLSNGIPKILHSTWKTKKLLNNYWEKVAAGCRHLNQRFTFCHWDDTDLEDFIASKYPSFLHHFLSYPYPIQRADVSRYLLLLHYGGFYKDTNLGCNVPFNYIIHNLTLILLQQKSSSHPVASSLFTPTPSHSQVLLYKVDPWGIAADILATPPSHPFFLFIYEGLKVRATRYGLPYLDVIFGTGPLFLGEMYQEYLADPNVDQNSKNDFIIPPTQLDQSPYFYALGGGTWHCLDGQMIWWFYNHIDSLCLMVFSLVCLLSLCYKRGLSCSCFRIRI